MKSVGIRVSMGINSPLFFVTNTYSIIEKEENYDEQIIKICNEFNQFAK